jgi:hypothetical protein
MDELKTIQEKNILNYIFKEKKDEDIINYDELDYKFNTFDFDILLKLEKNNKIRIIDDYFYKINGLLDINNIFLNKIVNEDNDFKLIIKDKPINLGFYAIDNKVIEIFKCEKVGIYFHKYMGKDDVNFYPYFSYPTPSSSHNKRFGFDSKSDMLTYCKALKHLYAYIIWFKIINE